METLKVACPRCGSIEAFAHAHGQLSFASLVDEVCAQCRHQVTFADVNAMRRQLEKAIAFAGGGMRRALHSRRVETPLACPLGPLPSRFADL